jgi:hypothetical protein
VSIDPGLNADLVRALGYLEDETLFGEETGEREDQNSV